MVVPIVTVVDKVVDGVPVVYGVPVVDGVLVVDGVPVMAKIYEKCIMTRV